MYSSTVVSVVLLVVVGVVAGAPSPSSKAWKFNNVYVLKNDNHKEFISNNDKVLVIFYSPMCSLSAKWVPRFHAAAMELGDTNVKLAQVRCPPFGSHPDIQADNLGDVWVAWEYTIDFPSRYPHYVYFLNGKKTDLYSGGKTKDGIMAWVRAQE